MPGWSAHEPTSKRPQRGRDPVAGGERRPEIPAAQGVHDAEIGSGYDGLDAALELLPGAGGYEPACEQRVVESCRRVERHPVGGALVQRRQLVELLDRPEAQDPVYLDRIARRRPPQRKRRPHLASARAILGRARQEEVAHRGPARPARPAPSAEHGRLPASEATRPQVLVERLGFFAFKREGGHDAGGDRQPRDIQ